MIPPALSQDLVLTVDPDLPQRSPGVLTRATSDRDACAVWLAKYAQSHHTFLAYQKEADRLLLWCDWRALTLYALAVEDVAAFRTWLQDPQPREMWCSSAATGSLRRHVRTLTSGEANPEWRPFVNPLGTPAARQSMVILFGLFEHLVAVGYLQANVFKAARTRIRQPQSQGIERFFDHAVWSAFLAWLEAQPRDSERAEKTYQRNKFLIEMLYLLGLRQSEMAAARTTDILTLNGQLWLRVTGKGKTQNVPMPADAVAPLRQYRVSVGMSSWPEFGEDVPLLMGIIKAFKWQPGDPAKCLTGRAVHHITKTLFQAAAGAMIDPAIAQVLQKASTHWLRHTCASHMLSGGIDPLVCRDHLRHSSLTTTEIYLQTARDKQHRATEQHRVRPDTGGVDDK
ncbi:tyrosine-type recombinase/integrase [Propionivibrio sp.]|uniref:tyrosine-type recombinase/integrase n=1 Tax=Propionivibrio sp. TaxID=2212460 RepID=UPI003BF227D2